VLAKREKHPPTQKVDVAKEGKPAFEKKKKKKKKKKREIVNLGMVEGRAGDD